MSVVALAERGRIRHGNGRGLAAERISLRCAYRGEGKPFHPYESAIINTGSDFFALRVAVFRDVKHSEHGCHRNEY